jgi:hypothetical protein
MKLTEEELKTATLEAIYWWNRNENYYHYYFSRLTEIHKNKPLLEFFTNKIFETFLKEYSVRRNISAGFKNVDTFLDELIQSDFVNIVLSGDTDIIDIVSDKIKQNQLSTKRQTKSLLSKIAFLINPNDFSLYDTLAKESIWTLSKENDSLKKYQLENYSDFIKQVHIMRREISFKTSFTILNDYNETPAKNFFSNREKAFEMRIIDKHLWLIQQSSSSRKTKNNEYLNFINL